MAIELPPLPYGFDALEPHISAQTMEIHYGKHHQGYADKVNDAIKGTEHENATLVSVVTAAAGSGDQDLFNSAAQMWNHDFFWKSMGPERTEPSDVLKTEINKVFGGMDGFKEKFVAAGGSEFGSGWAWLILNSVGALEIISTTDADTPLVHDQTPLLTCDVWEHAYYLDYQNRRGEFLETFVDHLVNWDFASENFAAASGSKPSW